MGERWVKSKYRKVWLLSLILCLLTGCKTSLGNVSEESVLISNIQDNELLYITEYDRSTEYKEPMYIDLSIEEEGIIIEKGGEYILSGEHNQTIIIDAHDEIVHLFLDNITLQTTVGPGINVVSAGKLIVTLVEGSDNTIYDAAYYNDEELNGTISATCDVTINGNGKLNVCGYYKDALYTKDVLKIIGGNIQLKAKRYGIKGNDGIVLAPEVLVIESEKNGCQTSNHSKEGKGIIDVWGGTINIVAGEYGLSAVSDIYIRGGETYINSVIADIYTEGQHYIAEGVVWDE